MYNLSMRHVGLGIAFLLLHVCGQHYTTQAQATVAPEWENAFNATVSELGTVSVDTFFHNPQNLTEFQSNVIVTANPNPFILNQPSTIHAKVSVNCPPGNQCPLPAGVATMDVPDLFVHQGPSLLDANGEVDFQIPASSIVAEGPVLVTVTYSGQANAVPGPIFGSAGQVWGGPAYTTALTIFGNTVGHQIVLSAVITDTHGQILTNALGTMTFKDGKVTLAALHVHQGRADYAFVPQPGTHRIKAIYSGGANQQYHFKGSETPYINMTAH